MKKWHPLFKIATVLGIIVLIAAAALIYAVHEMMTGMFVGDFAIFRLQRIDADFPTLTGAALLQKSDEAYAAGLKIARREWNPSRPNEKALMGFYADFLKRHKQPERAAQIQSDLAHL